MVGDSACLGLEFLGTCRYDPAAPDQSFFTIGQLISVIALLLAFSQLTKPIIKFRVRARKVNSTAAMLASGFAIACIFSATILPFMPGKAWPLLGYPVVYEILAGLVFVIVAGWLLWAISNPPSFHGKNADAYFKACGSIIAKGKEDDLGELADEIFVAVNAILDECSRYDHNAARQAERTGQEYPIKESTRIAFTILDLWSDKAFCRSIVCRAPSTALRIFKGLIHHVQLVPGYALSQQLVHQAFMNRESILMREEDYSGLGFFKEFRNTVFGDWHFVDSRYRPLESWRPYEEQVHPWQVKKYTECLKTSLDSYFIAEDYSSLPSSLYVGLDNLADLARAPVSAIRKMSEQGAIPQEVFKVLREISWGFEKITELVEERHDRLPSCVFDEDHYDRFKDNSIYGVIAYAIYKYFETLAMALRHDRLVRGYAIDIWLNIFGVGTENSRTGNEIGKRLVIHLNKKIHDNLDAKERWYPLVTRLIMSLNGIYESNHDDNSNVALGMKFHKAFLERLKVYYPKLAKVDPEFASELLPEDITYDSASNRLIHKGLRQHTTVLELSSAE